MNQQKCMVQPRPPADGDIRLVSIVWNQIEPLSGNAPNANIHGNDNMWNDNDTILIKIVGIIVLLACMKILLQQQIHAHPEYEKECPICVELLDD